MSSIADQPRTSSGGANTAAIHRLAWVDNLRMLIIVLVVNMHACVTYSHVGSWYIVEQPEPSMAVKIAFLFWQGHVQAFFMGLLFFLAGVFAHGSLARRGPRAFVKERLIRLGIPALLYMVLIHPLMIYVLLGHPRVPDRPALPELYWTYLTSGRVVSGNGPLWFAWALLAFCMVLAGWRALSPMQSERASPHKHPGVLTLLLLGAGLALGTFLVRTIQPIGTNILNFQLCFFPQYVAAFAAGVLAGRDGWLEAIASTRCARIAGWVGLFGGPLLLGLVLWLGGPFPETGPNPYEGGWHYQALALATWEQLTGLALALGLLALFRRRVNLSNPLSNWLSSRAFAVYVLHAPVLVALTFALRPIEAGPFTRAALLTVFGLAASFLVADLAKRVPGLRAVL